LVFRLLSQRTVPRVLTVPLAQQTPAQAVPLVQAELVVLKQL
tara:strand:- start:197 stop:322 length:126 start_codon:yes stop_codon:yes gene_type:complete